MSVDVEKRRAASRRRYLNNPARKIKYKKYRETHPWYMSFMAAKFRCSPKGSYYGKRKFLMTLSDFKYLWFRDKAYDMSWASIDRINNSGDYTLKNCRFIEFSENSRKGCK